MKFYLQCLVSILLLVLPFHLRSQGYSIDQVPKLLQMSDTLRLLGKYDRALTLAEESEKVARREKHIDLQALALNKQGKIMMAMNKKNPDDRFQKSNDLLSKIDSKNTALILDNFNQLKTLATARNDKRALADIDYSVSKIKKGQTLEQASAQAEKLKEEILTIEEEKEKIKSEKDKIESEKTKLNETLEEQTKQSQQLQSDQEKLKKESKRIQLDLAAKKAALENMTNEQMKAEVIRIQQEQELERIKSEASLQEEKSKNLELQVSESKAKRNFLIALSIALLGLFGSSLFGFFKSRQNAKLLSEKNKQIEFEKNRSDQLLLNILPESVASELKSNGFTKASHFEEVTVCFADFVGFTTIAGVTDPQKLLGELNVCFKAFDDIIAKYDLEKIKTIGDCYMFAGGLPIAGKGSQIIEMIHAAKDMQAWLDQWNVERQAIGQPRMDVRIGIHMGPVAAGVIGSKKFAYDIWGDTVNMAARLEQSSERGKINISGEAYEKVKDVFKCQYRGKLPAKNKGLVDMYFVEN